MFLYVLLTMIMNTLKKVASAPTTDDHDYSCGVLRSASLFANLSDEEFACFQSAAQLRTHKKGKVIYLQGEPARFFYIVNAGWVKLFRTMPEGDEVIVDMLTTGHMFGESAMFEHDIQMCSAQVVEDVQLFSIPSRLLKEQISLNPKLAMNMLAAMSRHHRHHSGALAFNAMLSAPQRIGCFLLKLCPEGKASNVAFDFPYDKTLIADTLGMKGATFSRALNILRQKTGIHVEGSRIEIESVVRLAQFVYGALATHYVSADM